MSISWQLDETAALLVVPPDVASLDEAHAAIELWEHYSRKVLDKSQRLTVEVMMAQRAGGVWSASTTGREMPRQNGKGDEVEVVELWGLVQRGEAILHTVHDAVLLATQTQQRMIGVLEGHPDLRRLVKRMWQGTGQQMIEMRNGGIIWYRTRTGGGGRGVDLIDRLVVDEAQHATEEHLSAVAPTLLANENPQMNVLGTAGIDGKSDWWWSVRKRALSPAPGAFGYVGHTAETVRLDMSGRIVQEPVDVTDRDLWLSANPAIVAGRGQGLAFLEEQLLRLGEASFAREHLGVWDPPPGEGQADIDPARWAALEHQEASRPSPIALAVAVSEDHKWSHICLAGRRKDGRTHVQVVVSAQGTDWVPARMAELVETHQPVRVMLNGAAAEGSLLTALDEYGVEVELVKAREVLQASGAFADAVTHGTLRHQNDPQLNLSVRVAGKKPYGEAWLWRSNDPSIDIAPLRGVTLALHALVKAGKPKRSGLVVGIR